MRTEDECGWEGVTGRSCGDSPWGDFKLARMKAKSRWNKDSEVRRWDGSITTNADLVPDS